MRTAQEFVEQAKFVHYVQRGGMDSVSSKVPEKVRVLFEDNCLYADAGQQKS
jgi:hypothetical protein